MFTPNQIHELLKNIHSQLTCPRCQQRYATGQIEPVELSWSRGVFACSCSSCSTGMMITLNIRDFRQRIAARSHAAAKVATEKVGPGDVVDFAGFLKTFDGDFAKFWQDKEPQPRPQPQEPPAGA